MNIEELNIRSQRILKDYGNIDVPSWIKEHNTSYLRAKEDPLYFYKRFFPDYCIKQFPSYYEELVQAISKTGTFNNTKVITGLFPIAHGKSTFIFMECIRQLVCYSNHSILYYDLNYNVSKRFLYRLYDQFKTNVLLQQDYPIIKTCKRTEHTVYLDNDSVCSITAVNHDNSLLYTNIIFFNDIESYQFNDKYSNDKRINFIKTLCNQNKHKTIVCIGTPRSKHSYLLQLHRDKFIEHKFIELYYPALEGSATDIEYCFKYLNKNMSKPNFDKIDWLLEDIESAWPSRYSVTDLLCLYTDIGEAAFKHDFMLDY